MIYVLKIKIKNNTSATLPEIEKYLKTEFKNFEYMEGFLDGYLFDNYKVVTLETFERELNIKFREEYFIKFLSVELERKVIWENE